VERCFLQTIVSLTLTFAAGAGGAVVNMLSALSWFSYDGVNAYAAAKAAEWSLTNGVRLELAAQGTQVTGVHVGAVDTDLMAGYDGPMVTLPRSPGPRSTAWRRCARAPRPQDRRLIS